MSRKKKWFLGIGLLVVLGVVAIFVAAAVLARRFEPYIREQAILYLSTRFESEVEIAAVRVRMPKTSPFRLLLTRGRGVSARVEGEGISLRHKGRRDVPPLFTIKKFACEVDLATLFDSPKTVPLVSLDGLEIQIPPKGERPNFGSNAWDKDSEQPQMPVVIIREVAVNNAKLVILPKDKKKFPLQFDIHRLRLWSARSGVASTYDALLTNPKPPGAIISKGTFGPWIAEEPGDTPLRGEYTFEKADLSVFSGIAGILNSTGRFEGSLSAITARGQASVPDFRLKMSGNAVSLSTQFEVLVDGTNGNTILKPVVARLGTTDFTTSGGVIRHEGNERRAISLDVSMPKGNLRDLLRLAMKGPPFMEGQIFLKTKINIPPLTGRVREKLELDGQFQISEGKFLRSTIQNQLDSLSRRGQGQPTSEEIDQVVSMMNGAFKLSNEVITFSRLSFQVPGANVNLAGDYDLDRDALEFHGALRLRAMVSQTMTGWKRWALKPADPFFAKQGAGTFLRIKVEGTSKEPKFGLDRGPNEAEKRRGVQRGKPAA
jgi:AsmA-like C-terminal region